MPRGAFAFAGKIIEFKVDNGVVLNGTHSDDGRGPHCEAVDGSPNGAVHDVHLQAAEVVSIGINAGIGKPRL